MQSEGTLSPAEFPTLPLLNSTPHYSLVPPPHTLGDVYMWLEYTVAQRYSFMKTVCVLEKCENGFYTETLLCTLLQYRHPFLESNGPLILMLSWKKVHRKFPF